MNAIDYFNYVNQACRHSVVGLNQSPIQSFQGFQPVHQVFYPQYGYGVPATHSIIDWFKKFGSNPDEEDIYTKASDCDCSKHPKLVRKILEYEININSAYKYQAPDNDLVLTPEVVRRVRRMQGRDVKPGESVHEMKSSTPKIASTLMIFKSLSDHVKFHNFDPTRQSLEQTSDGAYFISERKKMINVNQEERGLYIQAKHGPVPYMFSSVAPSGSSEWKKRW